MFGKIINFENNDIILENIKKIADANYIGYHVIFAEQDHKIVGEITSISEEIIKIHLIGEIINNIFYKGVVKKPSANSNPRIIYKSELELILGNQNYQNNNTLLFGTSSIYQDYFITSDLSSFLANHFAILGNSGAGKSCGVSRLLQNLFYTSTTSIPKNAHICLFDAYGEYANTFNELNNITGLHYKKYTTNLELSNENLLVIPPYLLEVDDLAILLNATSSEQIPVLQKTLDLVKVFTSQDSKSEDYKNSIISNCILEILSSGKNANQIRDQIIYVLTKFNTNSLNINSIIHQPGYDRTLKQCLNIDDQGKINAINTVINYLQEYNKLELEEIKITTPYAYTLNDIYYALEFALINEGSLVNNKIYESNNILKSRLFNLINSENIKYFQVNEYIGKSDFVKNFFQAENKETAQIVDINLSFVDDKFAKSIVKIYSKLFFEYTTSLNNRGSYPIHILLEEAHRYVQNDKDTDIIGYNIFDRITKEGRKYGTILGFITQRPSELSKTALSQCSNFLVYRLFYHDDLNIIKNLLSDVTEETLEKIKTLHTGTALGFGSSFKIPLFIKFSLPNPLPISTSLNIENIWYQ